MRLAISMEVPASFSEHVNLERWPKTSSGGFPVPPRFCLSQARGTGSKASQIFRKNSARPCGTTKSRYSDTWLAEMMSPQSSSAKGLLGRRADPFTARLFAYTRSEEHTSELQ